MALAKELLNRFVVEKKQGRVLHLRPDSFVPSLIEMDVQMGDEIRTLETSQHFVDSKKLGEGAPVTWNEWKLLLFWLNHLRDITKDEDR